MICDFIYKLLSGVEFDAIKFKFLNTKENYIFIINILSQTISVLGDKAIILSPDATNIYMNLKGVLFVCMKDLLSNEFIQDELKSSWHEICIEGIEGVFPIFYSDVYYFKTNVKFIIYYRKMNYQY